MPEDKSIKRNSKNLEPIPNDFWKVGKYEAEREVHKPKQVSCNKGDHSFRRTKTTEVECLNCPVGFTIPSYLDVRDGHIYNEEKVLV